MDNLWVKDFAEGIGWADRGKGGGWGNFLALFRVDLREDGEFVC